MTDFNEHGDAITPATPTAHSTSPNAAPSDTNLNGPRMWAHVMYGLHAISAISGILTSATIVGSFIFGWPSIIALIINYITRDQVRNTWMDSHWRWQQRTFWFAFLWGVFAALLAVTIIGLVIAIPAIVATGVWVLYRVVRGWLNLLEGRAMPLPLTS
jgi:uncharacterized membrane protein